MQAFTEGPDGAELLQSISEVVTWPFAKEARIIVMCTGPKDTPYAGEKFELSFQIPRDYPAEPFDICIKQQVYHLNIEQFPKEPYHQDNKVMV